MRFEQLKPNTLLFYEAGAIPGGGFWVTPTDILLRLWRSPAGNDLRARGFRMRTDGTLFGAPADRVIVFRNGSQCQ